MNKKAVIIGAGFAGLSSACFMAKAGWDVTVIEKNGDAGGRAAQLKEAGFTFDMGPSWYWMPDVFDRFFSQFGKKASDYYSLLRLDPSYRVYWDDSFTDLPAGEDAMRALFENFEKGAGKKLDQYLAEAAVKYRIGMGSLVYKPGLSVTEFFDGAVIRNMLKLDVITSIRSHVKKYFRNAKLRQLMEFPVLFLGALPQNTPALYSLMNYADIAGGTWYPTGGMFSVVKGMKLLAEELGVKFHFNEAAQKIEIEVNRAKKLVTDKAVYEASVIISGADYHFTETSLLPPSYRSYSDGYWEKKTLAPSCLMFYVGLNKKLNNVQHHSLFFDVPFEPHANEIYSNPAWPAEPLFYLSVASKSDPLAAPQGCENLVFLVPVASGLGDDSENRREMYFQQLVRRLEQHTGESIADAIIVKKSFSVSDFERDYNSFKGNAYGLANTLSQTAIFRPSCQSKKLKNLFYTGQFTVPGPGVPPSIISGEVVSKQVLKSFKS